MSCDSNGHSYGIYLDQRVAVGGDQVDEAAFTRRPAKELRAIEYAILLFFFDHCPRVIANISAR
jgi:hypothetical protein